MVFNKKGLICRATLKKYLSVLHEAGKNLIDFGKIKNSWYFKIKKNSHIVKV